MSERPWDHAADYYSTSDQDEILSHEELDECLEAHLDDRPRRSLGKAIADGVTVYAWSRDAIDVEGEAKRALDSMVESLSISILEEYGDPDGDSKDIFGPEVEEAFKIEALPIVKALVSKSTPWRCSVIGERTFTSYELLAWVRYHNPKWLEDKS